MSAITVVENSSSDLVANASLLCTVQSWVSLWARLHDWWSIVHEGFVAEQWQMTMIKVYVRFLKFQLLLRCALATALAGTSPHPLLKLHPTDGGQ